MKFCRFFSSFTSRAVFSRSVTAWTVGLSVFASLARAEEPPTRPILRVNTQMHTTGISGMAVSADETFFVTCSGDATLRIWDTVSGELQKTVRVPYAPDDGQLNSVAISPDGKWIATAGRTGYSWDKAVSVYLIERESGNIVRRFKGSPEAVQILRFSPDGKSLAAGLVLGGLRVFRFSDGELIATDKEYDGDCIGMSFRPDGVLATAGLDGMMRLYEPDFKLAVRKKVTGGSHPPRNRLFARRTENRGRFRGYQKRYGGFGKRSFSALFARHQRSQIALLCVRCRGMVSRWQKTLCGGAHGDHAGRRRLSLHSPLVRRRQGQTR